MPNDEAPTGPSTKNQSQASAGRPFNPDGGEDEGGAPDGGNDSDIRDDQKPITGNSAGSTGGSGNERHKTEELTKAGRDIDPDDGSE